jgi:hypothetical protein
LDPFFPLSGGTGFGRLAASGIFAGVLIHLLLQFGNPLPGLLQGVL